ncbi:collagen alpha-1(I) chain-like isoform X2 [Oxyura jamaicensis]|uniref:collagen alpha-1(I) chain-like isoform X2 n=1 Tax=Oxyura jamaicensis TaxID=8884 RepID=UPI0015A575A4|nr:collagen alpha-1(I) chain-like isoform X2 [Oxyura jamaicensis]
MPSLGQLKLVAGLCPARSHAGPLGDTHLGMAQGEGQARRGATCSRTRASPRSHQPGAAGPLPPTGWITKTSPFGRALLSPCPLGLSHDPHPAHAASSGTQGLPLGWCCVPSGSQRPWRGHGDTVVGWDGAGPRGYEGPAEDVGGPAEARSAPQDGTRLLGSGRSPRGARDAGRTETAEPPPAGLGGPPAAEAARNRGVLAHPRPPPPWFAPLPLPSAAWYGPGAARSARSRSGGGRAGPCRAGLRRGHERGGRAGRLLEISGHGQGSQAEPGQAGPEEAAQQQPVPR